MDGQILHLEKMLTEVTNPPHTIMKDKTIICFGHVLKNLSYKIQPVLWLILETTLTVEEMFRETRRGVR